MAGLLLLMLRISVRDRYETLERTFRSLYLNPGTNGSDKQDLTLLEVILKKTAEAKDLAAENCRKSAQDKAAKKQQQFRMQGPSPTKTVDASASSSSSFTPQSEDEFEILTVRGASQRKFQRLSSEEVEREFERLSPEEVAKLTPEERCEYQRQADFLHDLFELQEEEDASGEAALRARFDNDNRASKRRRVSTPNGEDDVSEIAEQLKKNAEEENARAAAKEEADKQERAAEKEADKQQRAVEKEADKQERAAEKEADKQERAAEKEAAKKESDERHEAIMRAIMASR